MKQDNNLQIFVGGCQGYIVFAQELLVGVSNPSGRKQKRNTDARDKHGSKVQNVAVPKTVRGLGALVRTFCNLYKRLGGLGLRLLITSY